jgi:hypothetical protein
MAAASYTTLLTQKTVCVCYFCLQILRRLLLHGFQPDCKTLQPVPAVNIVATSVVKQLLGLYSPMSHRFCAGCCGKAINQTATAAAMLYHVANSLNCLCLLFLPADPAPAAAARLPARLQNTAASASRQHRGTLTFQLVAWLVLAVVPQIMCRLLLQGDQPDCNMLQP